MDLSWLSVGKSFKSTPGADAAPGTSKDLKMEEVKQTDKSGRDERTNEHKHRKREDHHHTSSESSKKSKSHSHHSDSRDRDKTSRDSSESHGYSSRQAKRSKHAKHDKPSKIERERDSVREDHNDHASRGSSNSTHSQELNQHSVGDTDSKGYFIDVRPDRDFLLYGSTYYRCDVPVYEVYCGSGFVSSDTLAKRQYEASLLAASNRSGNLTKHSSSKQSAPCRRYFNCFPTNAKDVALHGVSGGGGGQLTGALATMKLKRLHTQAVVRKKQQSQSLSQSATRHTGTGGPGRTIHADFLPLPLCGDEDIVAADTEGNSSSSSVTSASNTNTNSENEVWSEQEQALREFSQLSRGLERLTDGKPGLAAVTKWLMRCQAQGELVHLQRIMSCEVSGRRRPSLLELGPLRSWYTRGVYWDRDVLDRKLAVLGEGLQTVRDHIAANACTGTGGAGGGVVSHVREMLHIAMLRTHLAVGTPSGNSGGLGDCTSAAEDSLGAWVQEARKECPFSTTIQLLYVQSQACCPGATLSTLRRDCLDCIRAAAEQALNLEAAHRLTGMLGGAGVSTNHAGPSEVEMDWFRVDMLRSLLLMEQAAGLEERASAAALALIEITLGTTNDKYLNTEQLQTTFEMFWEQEFPRLGDPVVGSYSAVTCGFYEHLCVPDEISPSDRCSYAREHSMMAQVTAMMGGGVAGGGGTPQSSTEKTPTANELLEKLRDLATNGDVEKSFISPASEKVSVISVAGPPATADTRSVQPTCTLLTGHATAPAEPEMVYSRVHGYRIPVKLGGAPGGGAGEGESAVYRKMLEAQRGRGEGVGAGVANGGGTKSAMYFRPTDAAAGTESGTAWDQMRTARSCENGLSILQWKALKATEEADGDAMISQPERVVIYEDIKDYMLLAQTSSGREYMAASMLRVLGAISFVPGASTKPSGDNGVDVFKHHWLRYMKSRYTADEGRPHTQVQPPSARSLSIEAHCCQHWMAEMCVVDEHIECGLFNEESLWATVGSSESTASGNVERTLTFDSKLNRLLRVLLAMIIASVHAMELAATSSSSISQHGRFKFTMPFIRSLICGSIFIQGQRYSANTHLLTIFEKRLYPVDNKPSGMDLKQRELCLRSIRASFDSEYQSSCRQLVQLCEIVTRFHCKLQMKLTTIPPPPKYNPLPHQYKPPVLGSVEIRPPLTVPPIPTPTPIPTSCSLTSIFNGIDVTAVNAFVQTELVVGRPGAATKLCFKSALVVCRQIAAFSTSSSSDVGSGSKDLVRMFLTPGLCRLFYNTCLLTFSQPTPNPLPRELHTPPISPIDFESALSRVMNICFVFSQLGHGDCGIATTVFGSAKSSKGKASKEGSLKLSSMQLTEALAGIAGLVDELIGAVNAPIKVGDEGWELCDAVLHAVLLHMWGHFAVHFVSAPDSDADALLSSVNAIWDRAFSTIYSHLEQSVGAAGYTSKSPTGAGCEGGRIAERSRFFESLLRGTTLDTDATNNKILSGEGHVAISTLLLDARLDAATSLKVGLLESLSLARVSFFIHVRDGVAMSSPVRAEAGKWAKTAARQSGGAFPSSCSVLSMLVAVEMELGVGLSRGGYASLRAQLARVPPPFSKSNGRTARILPDGTHLADVEILHIVLLEFLLADYSTLQSESRGLGVSSRGAGAASQSLQKWSLDDCARIKGVLCSVLDLQSHCVLYPEACMVLSDAYFNIQTQICERIVAGGGTNTNINTKVGVVAKEMRGLATRRAYCAPLEKHAWMELFRTIPGALPTTAVGCQPALLYPPLELVDYMTLVQQKGVYIRQMME